MAEKKGKRKKGLRKNCIAKIYQIKKLPHIKITGKKLLTKIPPAKKNIIEKFTKKKIFHANGKLPSKKLKKITKKFAAEKNPRKKISYQTFPKKKNYLQKKFHRKEK